MSSIDLVESLVGKHVASGDGCNVAYVDPEIGEVTYRQLYRAAGRCAARLTARGISSGSRFLVVADDSVSTVAMILGSWWHGCVPVPISPSLTEQEIGFIAEDSGAACVYLDVPATKATGLEAVLSWLPQFDRAPALVDLADATDGDLPPTGAQLPPGREALVQYTSGSTGRAKGVLHSAAALLAVSSGFGQLLALAPSDTVLSTAKLSFGYGFGNSVLLPLHAGARTVLLRGGVDAYVVASAVRSHRPTVLCSVPRIYAALPRVLGDDGLPDHALRLAITAGERCPAELIDATERLLGVPVLNGLGATEALHIVVATADSSAPGATGRAVPGVVATVRDEAGNALTDGTDGRLHIAGPTVAMGYLNRPDAQRNTFADGGVYTGDIARVADGTVHYLARADDMLNLGGHKVAPGEIERVIQGVAGVIDCAVVSGRNADGLDDAIAYIVATGSDPAIVRRAVLAALRTDLAPFKRPSRIELVDALPTTSTGKLARFQLRTAGAR